MRKFLGAVVVAIVYGQLPAVCWADLLVAGFSADMVFRVDGTTGALMGTFASHATMNGPTAMVYNPAGNLLVLNEFSTNVLEFNGTTGAFIGELVSPMALGSVGATDPGDMEIGADGHLYITSHFSTGGNNIWKFNGTTGAYMGVFASTGVFHHTHGLAFGPDGNAYHGDLSEGRIIRFDGTTGTLIGTYAMAPGLTTTADLVFGPTGILYVSIDGGGGVLRFSPGGAPLSPLLAPGPSTWGLLVDGGTLYVGDKGTGIIKAFDAISGAYISDFTSVPSSPFDMIPLATAVPEVGAAAMLTLAASCLAGVLAIKKRLAATAAASHSGMK